MTPPKPVDLIRIRQIASELTEDGFASGVWAEDLLLLANELEYLRARVKELEDGKN